MGTALLRIVYWGTPLAALALSVFGHVPAREAEGKAADSKYIGAAKCKNCHRAERAGNQFGAWQKMEHTKAFEALASDEAKKIAKEKGIDDPQKSEKCLKCHMTAFGEPADHVTRKFDPKLGIQCESCHGPGEKHFKDRLAAAGGEEEGQGDPGERVYVKIPAEEIHLAPFDACLRCHNQESPTFQPICIDKAFKEVMHLDPRKKRSEADLAALRKKITDELAAKNAGCGGPEKCGRCRKAAGK